MQIIRPAGKWTMAASPFERSSEPEKGSWFDEPEIVNV
jgi:hypothetical protein